MKHFVTSHCCVELQHLRSIFHPYLASPLWMHACLFVLAIPLAQKLDGKVMSQSLLNCGSWTSAGLLSPQNRPGHKLCKCVRSVLISLSHSFFNTFSLFILLTPSFSSRYFSLSSSLMFGVGPPSLLSRYLVCIQESDSHSAHREGGERRL